MSNAIQPKTVEHEPAAQQSSATSRNAVSLTTAHAAASCSVALIICFFLPWIDFSGIKASGFDLQKSLKHGVFLWAIPVFGSITVLASFIKQNLAEAGVLAAILPFGLFAYALCEHGTDFVKIVGVGGWLSLVSAALVFIFSTK